jgi:cysteine synthase A
MINKARELAVEHGWYLTRQFENEANADMHSRTTAVEILEDFADVQLDYWVTGFGTGGTLKGVGRVLKKESPNTKIILCEPDNAQLIASGVEQERNEDGSPAGSHPRFSPHPMQGWTPDFIPQLTEDALGLQLADRVIPVNGKDALAASRSLATQEGIFAGISSGATLAGALQICADAPAGSNVLCMLPDTGERYLSTPLFDEVGVDMDTAETEISKSTPNYQF